MKVNKEEEREKSEKHTLSVWAALEAEVRGRTGTRAG